MYKAPAKITRILLNHQEISVQRLRGEQQHNVPITMPMPHAEDKSIDLSYLIMLNVDPSVMIEPIPALTPANLHALCRGVHMHRLGQLRHTPPYPGPMRPQPRPPSSHHSLHLHSSHRLPQAHGPLPALSHLNLNVNSKPLPLSVSLSQELVKRKRECGWTPLVAASKWAGSSESENKENAKRKRWCLR